MVEIYGTAWTEIAKDKVISLIDALKTTMLAYDPTFSYVYDRHNVADLNLNAITISSLDFSTTPIGLASGTIVRHDIMLSIRVHTAYKGGHQQSDKNVKLLNSISNKLLDNENLLDNYRVSEISGVDAAREFDESGTLGGEMIVLISFMDVHTQEE